jgi:hypothetical protein
MQVPNSHLQPAVDAWENLRNSIEDRQDFVLEQLDQLADQVEHLVSLCSQLREQETADSQDDELSIQPVSSNAA